MAVEAQSPAGVTLAEVPLLALRRLDLRWPIAVLHGVSSNGAISVEVALGILSFFGSLSWPDDHHHDDDQEVDD
jgi:hypothetical protein